MTFVIRQATSVLVLVLVLTTLASSLYSEARICNWTRMDFAPYHAAANRLKDHDPLYVYNKNNLYTHEQYVYPPLPALMIMPFAGSDLKKVCRAWTLIDVLLLISTVLLYFWAVKLQPAKDLATMAIIAIIAFHNYPTVLQIFVGNIDLPILLCVVGVLVLARFGRWKQAALLISLAASIKTWAIGFTVFLIMMRKWKQALLAVFVFLAANTAMFAVLGLNEFEIFAKLQQAYSYQPKLNSNSIMPMCRLYSGLPTLEHHRPQMLFNGADSILPIVGLIASLIVATTFVAIAWRTIKSPPIRQMPLVMSICIMTYLLLTPLCHQYYYVYALPVIWNLIVFSDSQKRLGRAVEEDWVGITMWASALAAFLLLLVESPGLIEQGAYVGFARLAPLGYGTTLLAGLILWLASVIALVFDRPMAVDQAAQLDAVLLPDNDKSSRMPQAVG